MISPLNDLASYAYPAGADNRSLSLPLTVSVSTVAPLVSWPLSSMSPDVPRR